MSDLHPVTAVVTGVLGLAGGLLVPLLIARVPEPVPYDDEPEPPPKELYAEIAARPAVRWGSIICSGLAAAFLGLLLGWDHVLVVLLPLVPASVALAVIDWRTKLLPTRLVWPTFLVTVPLVLVSWLVGGELSDPAPLVRAVLGCVASFAIFYVLWFVYPRGMGFGDVRLSAVLGLALGFLGWSELLVGMYGGFLLGGVLGGLLTALKLFNRKGYPFGPFMLVGALLGVVLGQPVLSAIYG